MNGTFIAINIFTGTTIVNSGKVPIVFYWDATNDLTAELQNNEEFIDFLKSKVLNSKDYGTSYISYCYIDENEKYNEVSDTIQHWLPITQCKYIAEEYISKHFNFLYHCSYKENYEFNDVFEKDIINIYDAIKDKYPQKIAKTTVINYVRSQLQQEDSLNEDNVEFVINILENILKNKE